MYESPIELITRQVSDRIAEEQEKMILKTVYEQGVIVDKEELIKALNYDRNQYRKGYKDGVNDVLDKIKAEIEQTTKDYDKFDDYRRVRGLWIALEIIDKYKKSEEET